MPLYRFTMGFRQSGRTATETYYQTASSLNGAAAEAQKLMNARNKMLFTSTEWVGIRIGLKDMTRQAQLYTPGSYEQAVDGLTMTVPAKGTLGVQKTKNSADQPNSCIQISLKFDDNRSTKRYLSFIPDECVSGDPDSVQLAENGKFTSGYQLFQDLLVAGKWSILARLNTGINAEKVIQKWVASSADPAPLGVVLAKADAPPLAIGDKVAIKGTRRKGTDKMSYNGIYRVKEVVPDSGDTIRTIYLKHSEGGDPNSVKIDGKLQKVDTGPFPIQSWGWFRAGTHKRGASFGRVAGRRLTRVLLDP